LGKSAHVPHRSSVVRVRDLRSEQLANVAGAIANAVTREEVFEAIVGRVGAVLGAASSALWLVSDDGSAAELVRATGYSDAVAQSLASTSIRGAARFPAIDSIQRAAPVWIASREELFRTYPGLEAISVSTRPYCVACMPLIVGGRCIGSLALTFADAPPLDDDEQRLLLLIAQLAGQAVGRIRVLGGESLAGVRAELAELRETVRVKEIVTRILGHDLRNPLATILMAAEVLASKFGDERAAVPLAKMLRNGERIRRMIDQLVDFTSLRAGSDIELFRKRVDAAEILDRAIHDVATAGSVSKPECRGDATGWWDRDRLVEVFVTVIGNAVQHRTTNTAITVSADGSDADAVRFSVANVGAIPQHLVSTLFEPLGGGQRRLAGSAALGLGLFVARGIVTAHGGTISARSSDEEGTTVSVILPRSSPTANGTNSTVASR
jgi:signal transduction histidine kinase